MARAVISYKDPAADLIHAFKYRGQTSGFSTFKALWELSAARDDLELFDLILPVPLHLKRLQERGFNQAKLLAEIFFADSKDLIHSDLLLRVENTPHQVNLSGEVRRQNLKNAFAVAKKDKVLAKRVLLVDDVFTTGATVDECARVLRQAGASHIQVVTLARSFKL